MLIYLDTSHHNMLERLRHSDPARFASFVESWGARKRVLALSLNHAQELAQLGDETSRQRRLNMIGQFPRHCIRFSYRGSLELLEMELVTAIHALTGGERMPIERVKRLLFAHTFEEFTTIVNDIVQASHRALATRRILLEGHNQLAKVGREIENLRVQHNLPQVNLKDPNIQWDEMERLMESMIPKNTEDTTSGRILLGFIQTMNDLVKKHKSIRRATEELYGLRGMDVTQTLRPTDLAAAHLFFATAREKIKQIARALNIPLPLLMTLLPRLSPYKMPGYSLGIAISRARQMSGIHVETGDQVDDSHIAFAPYVDRLFVDKRTFAFVQQELRDRPELSVRPPAERVCFARSVTQLEKVLA